jgi:CubicO group peptidase (beta-lactamase class C family)
MTRRVVWVWRTVAAVVVAAAFVACLPTLCVQAPVQVVEEETESSQSTTLELEVAALRETYRFPAVVGCIIRADEIVETVVTGVRKVGEDDPVVAADLFHIGSMTKAMTSTMLATLVQEGRLQWDMTLTQGFPTFAGELNWRFRNVTLEQLLSHTAGLAGFTTDEEWATTPAFEGTPAQQRQAFAFWLLTRAPAVRVGVYRYSNAGYGIAAAIAEGVTGSTWEQLMQERLLGPLNIRARYGWPLLSGWQEPWGHWIKEDGVLAHDPADGYKVPTVLVPAGDVSVTIGDYAVFAQLHLAGLEGRGSAILTAAAIQRLHQPILKYSLGWHEELIDGIPTSSHHGSVDTFSTFVLLQPTRDVGVILFANADGNDWSVASAWQAARDLADAYGRPPGT